MLRVGGPHRATKSIIRIISNSDGLGFVVKRNNRKHRSKNFFLGDFHIVSDIGEHGGLYVPTLVEIGRSATTGYDPSTFGYARFKETHHSIPLTSSDEWPDLTFDVEWVTHFQCPHCRSQRFDYFVVTLTANQNTALRSTNLTVIHNSRLNKLTHHCFVKIYVVKHNGRRFTTEFKSYSLE